MKQIPRGLRLEEFKKTYLQLTEEGYEQDGGAYYCRACGTVAESGTAFVSLHTTLFEGCGGSGEVARISIPGCPLCEPEGYEMQACVHLAPGEEPNGYPFKERAVH